MAEVVREARPEDARSVAETHVESWRAGYRGLISDAYLDSPELFPARLRAWQRRLIDGNPVIDGVDDRVLVAASAERVAGFAQIGPERIEVVAPDGGIGVQAGTDGELYAFYVHPDYWGTAVADGLIARCHELLAEDFERASLWVLRDNPRARRFYARNGWEHNTEPESGLKYWPGPTMAGIPALDEPLAEVQYRRESTRHRG